MDTTDDDKIVALTQAIEETKDVSRRKRELDLKTLKLREHKTEVELEILEKNQKEIEQSKNLKFGELTDSEIQKIIDDNNSYMSAAKNSMRFLYKPDSKNEDRGFKGVVPFFRKNLILIGGDTGDGKSTTVANIIWQTIGQSNPETGKSCRVLVITNEEAREDIYNRTTCLMNAWKYTNHDQFTDEQKSTLSRMIPVLAKGGRLTVIGDLHENVSGCTTTVEGIRDIFHNLMRDKQYYDVVLIDYYQNIRFSRNNPKLQEFECQRELAAVLDQVKMNYPAPIVLMAQMKKLVGEDDQTPFNVRLKGSKLICDKATFICELIPERQLFRSKWKIWKSRFTDGVGEVRHSGFDLGRFVPYCKDFREKVAKFIDEDLLEKMQDDLGLPKPKDKKKKDKEQE